MPTILAARRQRLQSQRFKASHGFKASCLNKNKKGAKKMLGFKVIIPQESSWKEKYIPHT